MYPVDKLTVSDEKNLLSLSILLSIVTQSQPVITTSITQFFWIKTIGETL